MSFHQCLTEPSRTGTFTVLNPAQVLVADLDADHPLVELFRLHPWLGGFDHVCELFRLLLRVYGDRLGIERVRECLELTQRMDPDVLQRAYRVRASAHFLIVEGRRRSLVLQYRLAAQQFKAYGAQFAWLRNDAAHPLKHVRVEMTELFIAMLLCLPPGSEG